VDILRDASDKVIKYEATIDSYKKKLEELSSLKRQLKLLEDNNTSLLQANLALENDVKKTGNWKPQVIGEYVLLSKSNMYIGRKVQ
jgi:hypothetical protein